MCYASDGEKATTLVSAPVEKSSDPIRVLLADFPGVMNEVLLDLIQAQPDMVLVGKASGGVELLEMAGNAVDVVIMGASQTRPLPGIGSHLLGAYPDIRLLVVTYSGDQAVLYWLGLRQRQVRAMSSLTLLSRIRRAYRINPMS